MSSFNATLVETLGASKVQPRIQNTVVGTRALRPAQAWFEGHGRGYVREFVPVEGRAFCQACNEHHNLDRFPTFSVPRQDGRTRGNVCRTQVRAHRAAAVKVAARNAQLARARAAKAAKAAARKAA